MLKSLVPNILWTWESVLKYKDKKTEKILNLIQANKAHYLNFTVSSNIFLNQIEKFWGFLVEKFGDP